MRAPVVWRLVGLGWRRVPAASLRSAEFGRAADAALARASPASLTDGGDAVGTSRAPARGTSGPVASARRTSSPIAGAFARITWANSRPLPRRRGRRRDGRRCRGAFLPPRFARRNSVAPLTRRWRGLRPLRITDGEDAVGTSRASARRTSSPIVGLCVRGEGVVGSFYASAREHFSQSRAASFKKTLLYLCVFRLKSGIFGKKVLKKLI